MMKNIFATSLFLFITFIVYAHNGEDHSKSEDTISIQLNTIDSTVNNTEPPHNDMDMSAFSTYHPLIVHFPIVLLILLPFFQLVSLFKLQKEIGWVVIILTAIGFITAYLASNNFHPHTIGLSAQASKVLEEHDFYAYLTVWLSFTALALKLISQFVFKLNKWSEYVVLPVLIFAAYAVIMAGHHGAKLTHIEGIGPQGKYIEINMDHEEEHKH